MGWSKIELWSDSAQNDGGVYTLPRYTLLSYEETNQLAQQTVMCRFHVAALLAKWAGLLIRHACESRIQQYCLWPVGMVGAAKRRNPVTCVSLTVPICPSTGTSSTSRGCRDRNSWITHSCRIKARILEDVLRIGRIIPKD